MEALCCSTPSAWRLRVPCPPPPRPRPAQNPRVHEIQSGVLIAASGRSPEISIAGLGGGKMAEMEEGKVDAFHRPQGYEQDAAYLAQVSSLYPCRAR